jgi:hypothetical protein
MSTLLHFDLAELRSRTPRGVTSCAWNGQVARIGLRVCEERPFVPRFLTGIAPPALGRPK